MMSVFLSLLLLVLEKEENHFQECSLKDVQNTSAEITYAMTLSFREKRSKRDIIEASVF